MANETPQSGLDALPAKPKSAAERTAEVLAAGPGTSDILQKMQARVDELTSPWHGFQSALDDMVARARNNPAEALRQRAEQKQQEEQEIQNLGLGLANVDMLRQQLGGIRGGLQANAPTQGQQMPMGQNQGQAPQQGEQQDPNAFSGYNFKGVPLSVYEYQTLKNYSDQADISGFNAAFKAISDIHSRAQAESAANWGRYDTVDAVVSGTDMNGNYKNFSVKIPKVDLQNWQERGIVPPQLKGVLREPKIQPVQAKANGGAIRQMAVGGDPADAPVMPGSGMQNSALDTALSSIMGSAEAAPPAQGRVSVSPAPAIDYSMDPAFQKQAQQSALQQQEQQNQAELKSKEKEREEAGQFVGKISSMASSFDEIQRRANAIIDHASKHPDEFAYKQQTGPYAYLLEGAGAIPYAGKPIEQALEGVKEKVSGQDTINRRQETQGHANSLGIDYTQEKFGGTGARIGQGLTQIAQNAKNVGIDKPAEVNLVNAYMIYATAGKYKDLASAWQDYQRANPKNPDPFAFQQSPQYKAVEDKWGLFLDQKLNAIRNGTPPDGTKDMDAKGNEIIWQNGKPMRVKQ